MKNTLSLLFLAMLTSFAWSQEKNISGDYEGQISIPGNALNIILHLTEDDRRLTGTMDIPQQNAKDLKLDQVKYQKGEISFSLPDVPGSASFQGLWKWEVDSITGTFKQGGASLPVKLKRINSNDAQQKKAELAKKVEKIEKYINQIVKEGRIGGLSVAIVKDNEIVLNKGFGYSDVENKVACDEHTLFAIGSCTKAFTTGLLASLHDEGLFDWEKPVSTYIPYFGMKDEFAQKQINGVDICSHRSGLPRHDLIWYGAAKPRRELIESIKFMDPSKPFRTTWQYNNFMYLTAGVVAEEITQKKWEDLIQERLFNPLGMTDSKIHFEDFLNTKNKALGYQEEERKIKKMEYRNIDHMGPAGSIFSSSTDMAKWVQLFLNKGKANDKAILSEAQIEFLLSPKMIMNGGGDGETLKQTSYALGWMVSEYKGKTFIEHGGNIDGFTASVSMMPEENLGIVVLTNKNGTGIPPAIEYYVADLFLNNPEYNWFEVKMLTPRKNREQEEDAKKAINEKDKPKSTSSKKGPMHDLKSYTGEYTDAAYGKAIVYMENKKLKFKYNSFDLEMIHDNFETFKIYYEGQDMKLCFFTGPSGKIEWFQIQLEVLTKAITFNRAIPDYLNNETFLKSIYGDYNLDGETITIYPDKRSLWAKTSDGQNLELTPAGDNLFKLKGVEGYTIEFLFDDKNTCTKLISHQPNGDFEAQRKK